MLRDGWFNYPATMPAIWSFIAQRKHCKLNIIDRLLGCPQIKYYVSDCTTALLAVLHIKERRDVCQAEEVHKFVSTGDSVAYSGAQAGQSTACIAGAEKLFLPPPCPPTYFPLSQQSGSEQMAPPPLFFPTR